MQIDGDSTGAFKDTEEFSLLVQGNRVYAAWWDDRLVAGGEGSEIFVAVSQDRGVSWGPAVRGTFHYTLFIKELEQWHWDVDGTRVCIAALDTRHDHSGREEAFLYGSDDYGATFAPWWNIWDGNSHTLTDFDQIRVIGRSGTFHVATVADRDDLLNHRNDVFYASYDRSTHTQTSMISLSPNLRAVGGDVEHVTAKLQFIEEAGNFAVAFLADHPGNGNDELRVAREFGGIWLADFRVGGYTGGDDVDNPSLLGLGGGYLVVAWEDDRLNPTVEDSIWSATIDPFSGVWTEQGSYGVGGAPKLAGQGGDVGLLFTGPQNPDDPKMVMSRDGGVTFGLPVVIDGGQSGDADFGKLAYDSHYGTFLALWPSDVVGGVNQTFAGAVRRPTLTAIGNFSTGQPVSFEGFGFSEGTVGDAMLVLVSTSLGWGSALLPNDGRDVGLQVTPLLQGMVGNSNLTGLIDANGIANTPTFNLPPTPPGTTLYFAGVSTNSSVTRTFGDITNPIAVAVQ